VPARRSAEASAALNSSSGALELAGEDVLTLGTRELSRGVALSGSLKAVNSAVLKARVAGELVELGPREGDTVTAGQALGRIDATEAELRLKQAQHQVEAAQAQLDLARRQLDNNRALVGQGFISATSLDASVSNDNAANATLQAAQAGVELARKALGDTHLIAPISGQVAQRLAQPGERLAVDARVLEIVDLARLELEAALPAQDAGALRPGAAAQLEVEGIETPVAARIARINPTTQAGTRAVMVYLALLPTPAQARGLRNGLFARGQVELARLKGPALPLSAVLVDEAQPYVLVLEPDPADAGLAHVRHQRVVLGERGLPRDGAGTGPAAPGSPAPAAAAASGPALGGDSAAPPANAAAPDDWVEIRSGLPAGARVLRGSVGRVAEGSLARWPAAVPERPAASATAAPH
jgi:RND family efflux transporter MFP subunit